MPLSIEILSGYASGWSGVLKKDEVTMGRAHEADVRLPPEDTVCASGLHAKLVRRGERWFVESLHANGVSFKSRNGQASFVRKGEPNDQAGSDDPSAGMEFAETLEEVRAAIPRLPADEAKIVRMHCFEGKTLTECAAASGKHKAWISRLHARALQRLRQELLDPGSEEATTSVPVPTLALCRIAWARYLASHSRLDGIAPRGVRSNGWVMIFSKVAECGGKSDGASNGCCGVVGVALGVNGVSAKRHNAACERSPGRRGCVGDRRCGLVGVDRPVGQ